MTLSKTTSFTGGSKFEVTFFIVKWLHGTLMNTMCVIYQQGLCHCTFAHHLHRPNFELRPKHPLTFLSKTIVRLRSTISISINVWASRHAFLSL
jgi:hypothetical protein